MRKVFQNEQLQRQYEEDGFVTVPHFLKTEEINYLLKFYEESKSKADEKRGFHASLHSTEINYRRKVSEEICKIFTPKGNQFLLNCKPVFANFTVKEPDAQSGFDMHLDWSMVDEKKFVSFTFWVPLIDITDVNGYLWMLKKSHTFEYTIRGGPGLRLHVARKFSSLPPEMRYERVTLKLKAGMAVIYDHRVFHGSPPNFSQKTRVAINYTMIPQEAQSLHYEFRGDNKVEILEVDNDFYSRHILHTEPEGVKSLGFLDIEPNFMTQEETNSLILNTAEYAQSV